MSVLIKNVIPDSPADLAGIKAGARLVSIDGFPINDVLDYMFYGDDDMGLEFETFLMDSKRSCNNNCVFCFIDQNPPNMRDSIYLKDDDSRLSFLQGNYITLTNLTEQDVLRIIQMKTPVNVSVHTTNPELRSRIMGNPNAGESLSILRRFAEAGISMNFQLVLCPGINDGDELIRTLDDLSKLNKLSESDNYATVGSPASTACVPVGLTKHRAGLPPLRTFTKEESVKIIETTAKYKNVFAADEFYLKACIDIPEYEHYGDFPQYENGVGMLAFMKNGFEERVRGGKCKGAKVKTTIVTGTAAFGFMRDLVAPFANVGVVAVRNDFFGESVTVSGLLTGGDIISQLRGMESGELGERILIGGNCLNADGLFLDGTTPAEIESALEVKVQTVEPDGESLFDGLC
jgi:putative radical SAM enzyme (TIGR03279 family)